MLETLFAMLVVLAAWAMIAAAVGGIGVLLFPGFAARGDRPLAAMAWLTGGWCAAICFWQVWHLALPVDWRSSAVIVAFGAVGLVVRGRLLAAWLRGPRWGTWAVLLAIAVAWANLAIGPIGIDDTGLYHLQAARWNGAYPIVPGLGNLHPRLAFNNSSLLYAAAVDIGPLDGRGHHVGSGFLALAVLLPLAASLPKLWRGGGMWLSWAGRAMLIGPTILYSYKQTTSLSPDLPVTLIGIAIAVVLLDICVRLRAGGETQCSHVWWYVALVACVGVTVKLTFVAGGAVAVFVALRLAHFAGEKRWWLLVGGASIAAMSIGPWCARGVILSGYPAFPATIGGWDVPWRVKEADAKEVSRLVVAWAKTQDITDPEDGWSWIGPWFVHQGRDVLKVSLPIVLAVVWLAMYRVSIRERKGEIPEGPSLFWAAAPSYAVVAFVLFTAPDLSRFVGASLWIIAVVHGVAWLDAARARSPEDSRRPRRAVGIVVAAIGIISAGKAALYMNGGGGFVPIPAVPLIEKKLSDGETVYVPATGDKAWDAPLPSTPYAQPGLRLRRAGELGSGFVVD